MSYYFCDGLRTARNGLALLSVLLLSGGAFAADRFQVTYQGDPAQTQCQVTLFDQDHAQTQIQLQSNGDVRHEDVHIAATGVVTLMGVFHGTLTIQNQTLNSQTPARFLAVFDHDLLVSLHRVDLQWPVMGGAKPPLGFLQKGPEPEPDDMTETGDPIEPQDDIDP